MTEAAFATRLPSAPTILIVDDSATTREGLARLLETRGYRTAEAANGLEALERLRSDPAISLVLLDLLMPKASGYWLRHQQLQQPEIAHIPVVVLTGKYDARIDALQPAATLYKPISITALEEELERLVLRR
jgi:CheY-like chemotaxis protein